jgi:hypothetical protein
MDELTVAIRKNRDLAIRSRTPMHAPRIRGYEIRFRELMHRISNRISWRGTTPGEFGYEASSAWIGCLLSGVKQT